VATNLYCEITVDCKIVPFERVADHSGRNHLRMCAEFILLPKPSWSIFRMALLPGGELLHFDDPR
jgi:hypothetical protein